MPAGPLRQPVANHVGLVGGIVIPYQVHVEVAGNACFDLIERATELLGSMAWVALADYRTGGDIERREQGMLGLAHVVVAAPLRLAGAYGEHGLTAVQRLDLRFLVHAQHQGRDRWRHVEIDHIDMGLLAQTAEPAKEARQDGKPMALAGIWEGWRGEGGEVIRSFAIITTEANQLMSQVHDRMPLILEEADWPHVAWPRRTGGRGQLLRPARGDVLTS